MITQEFVGQISVVGECFCFGAALDGAVPAHSGGGKVPVQSNRGQQLVYLDLAGPATSVEAVWAKLAQAKECYVIPMTDARHFVPPGRDAEKIALRSAEGKLKRFQRKVEGIGIYHLVLLHQDILEPTYAELTTTYLFLTDKAKASAKLGAHVQALVDIAVFPTWFPYLVQQGRMERLLTPLTCYGGVKLWKLTLDKSAWERVVCRGLQQRVIRLP